jgi:hypothetical protein
VSAGSVAALVGTEVPDPAARARILRATCVGFAADDRDCRSLLVAPERIEEAIAEVLADPLAVRRGLIRRGFDLVRRGAGLLSARLDPLPAALRRYLRAHPRPLRLGERRRLLRAARSEHRDLGRLLRLDGSAELAWDRLREVAADHERLDEELVTLRTVQALAVLDVRQYRDLVHQLGEYGADGAGAGEQP